MLSVPDGSPSLKSQMSVCEICVVADQLPLVVPKLAAVPSLWSLR